MAPKRVIALMEDRAHVELALGGAKDRFHQPQLLVLELGALADAAKRAADRASGFIDDALAFIATSNKRIAAMEPKADQQPAWKAR